MNVKNYIPGSFVPWTINNSLGSSRTTRGPDSPTRFNHSAAHVPQSAPSHYNPHKHVKGLRLYQENPLVLGGLGAASLGGLGAAGALGTGGATYIWLLKATPTTCAYCLSKAISYSTWLQESRLCSKSFKMLEFSEDGSGPDVTNVQLCIISLLPASVASKRFSFLREFICRFINEEFNCQIVQSPFSTKIRGQSGLRTREAS